MPLDIVDNLAGPLAVGVWVNCLFYGLEVVQVVYYFRNYAEDPYLLKGVVFLACLNDTLGSMAICHSMYRWTVINFGNPIALAVLGWESPALAATTGVSVAICQSYLIWRFWRVSQLVYIAGVMAASALAGEAYIIYAVVEVSSFKLITDASRFSPIAETFLSIEAATDVLISFGLVIYLWKHYREAMFDGTKTMLRRVMMIAAESGTVTTLFALISVILMNVKKNSNHGIAIAYFLGRIYSLTLLCNLNIRKWNRQAENPNKGSISISLASRAKSTMTSGIHIVNLGDTPYTRSQLSHLKANEHSSNEV